MKKAISLLLALVMCLSLCACGGDNSDTPDAPDTTEAELNKLNLYQEWKALPGGQSVSFDKEGNFYINGQSYKFEYNEEANSITIDAGLKISCPVSLVNGIYRINIDGMDCVPASEFEVAYEEYARTMVVVSGFDGTPALNAALVHEHIDRVELTTDNWRDYIKVYQYDVEVVEKDAFGEVTNTEVSTVIRLGYGIEQYHYLDAIIELQHKETGEITIYGPASHQGKSFILDSSIDLDEYECTRIKGYLYFFDFTEEVIEEVIDVYDRWNKSSTYAEIKVTSGSFEGTWGVDCDAKVIENDSGNWSDYFD